LPVTILIWKFTPLPEILARRYAIFLSADLDDNHIQQIENALVKYKVLFFRKQHHLTDEAHQAFGARLGKIVAHPTVPSPAGTKLFELDASRWWSGRLLAHRCHLCGCFPKISILRGVTIPEYGGDTVWANTALAYELLPESLKQFVGTLRAIHSNNYDYGAERIVTEEHRLNHHKNVFLFRMGSGTSGSTCSSGNRRARLITWSLCEKTGRL
jgi:taurine dioxygenase